jgi:hypothetical protein
VFFLAAAVLAATAFFVYGQGPAARIRIQSPESVWVYPLAASERLAVQGPLGETLVEIKDGEARIVSSPCPNQLCVMAGPIHAKGQWLSCLPNQVIVHIETTEGDESSENAEAVDGASW